MVVHRRKKTTKWRGRSTHGGGARKKRRGAGSRGGRGRAGSGKRAGHLKFGIVLGSSGFSPRGRHAVSEKTINVGHLTPLFAEKLVSQGKASKEGNVYNLNLESLGYTKLLGSGPALIKMKITIDSCSERAALKVKQAGGEVTFLKKAEEKASKSTSS